MYEYDEEVLNTFLEKQAQLFSEEVAQTPEAAEEFLEDCMAVVCEDIHEVRDYFEDAGSDISGMSDDELPYCRGIIYEKDTKINVFGSWHILNVKWMQYSRKADRI